MRFLKVNEIANELRVTRNTVIALIKKGEISAIKVGDQYRVTEENYTQWLNTHKTGGDSHG
jgi:excisionase family DNA binding protein